MGNKGAALTVSQGVNYAALAGLLVAAVFGVIAISMGQVATGVLLVVLAVLGAILKVMLIRLRLRVSRH